MKSVIFSSEILILLYGAAILLCVFDLVKKASGYVFPVLSAVVFSGATVYAVLLGAGYEELCLVTLMFLMLNLGTYAKRRGGDKE